LIFFCGSSNDDFFNREATELFSPAEAGRCAEKRASVHAFFLMGHQLSSVQHFDRLRGLGLPEAAAKAAVLWLFSGCESRRK
jgi:hypothetical protein